MDVELEAALMFIANMNATSICEYIVAQQRAIDGLASNNQQLRKEFRKMHKEILKLKKREEANVTDE